MLRKIAALTVLLLSIYTAFAYAQAGDPSLLTLERIFSSNEFSSERFGPARWLEDGSRYTTLEPSGSGRGGRDIIVYDAETGSRELLVPAVRLIPAGEAAPLTIDDYTWSPDGEKLLIFTNTRRVWRTNTRGDYWILDLASRNLRKLGGDAPASTLMFATFSPDAEKVGYVCENNLYVEEIEGGRITRLTSDGSRTIINGTFDWVYEEELGLRNGFRWSPDSRSVAYWQLDAEGVGEFYMINNTDSVYSKIIPVQYPKAGTTNSACRVGVVSADGGATRWFNVPGDPRNNYIARMDWAASSDEIVIQHLNRLQNRNRVMLGDARTGSTRIVLTEQDDAWVNVGDDLNWLGGGQSFTWVSEQDGWRHVYRVSRNGRNTELVTEGNFDVVSIEHVDEENGWLYYIASPENPTQRYLYRIRLDGSGGPERLTPVDQAGTHSYQISPGAQWSFHTYSSYDRPPVIELARLPQHETVRVLAGNSVLRSRVDALKKQPVEFFRVDIGGGVLLDCWCIKPYDFDPEKRYPLLFHVYGEPAGQTVLDRWGGTRYLWHQMLAQQGYLVMSVDNRGTPAPRGREWRKSVYRQIGILASGDQAAAAEAIIRSRPYVDAGRIGIWGWSGGGSMSLNMIFRYPDLYHTAMSVAPVGNQRYYDTIYQERYMGLPEGNVEGFRDGSPVTFAHQLKGNLLIVHGTGDDNVHYQNTEAVINELIANNIPFTMMSYPNRSHGIYEGRNTTRHLYELLTRYLRENLPPGPVAR
ncbi:S9 family peptidase [candidate division KSB1 bacterium]